MNKVKLKLKNAEFSTVPHHIICYIPTFVYICMRTYTNRKTFFFKLD